MPPSRVKKLSRHSVLDEHRLLELFKRNGIKTCHAMTIWKHSILHGIQGTIADIPELPKKVYEVVPQEFGDSLGTSKIVEQNTSSDGTTTKILLEFQDGLRAESVIMRYDSALGRNTEANASRAGNKRATLCVSSQVGCQMGCTFCATGTMGLIGDLTAGEILEQLVMANKITPIRNIVFMGMGEPLNNYTEVVGAVKAMIDPRRFGLSPAHVTVSTVGVVPRIIQMAEDLPAVNFALSLHAPTQELRVQIVPSAKAFPLDKLMAAVDRHHEISGRAVFIEYVMLSEVNDGEEQARQLAELLTPRKGHVTVNLIPWNPMLAKDGAEPFDAPNPDNIQRFQITLKECGIPVTIRMTMGQDINGACGQLALSKGKQASNATPDIEDLGRPAGVVGAKKSPSCADKPLHTLVATDVAGDPIVDEAEGSTEVGKPHQVTSTWWEWITGR